MDSNAAFGRAYFRIALQRKGIAPIVQRLRYPMTLQEQREFGFLYFYCSKSPQQTHSVKSELALRVQRLEQHRLGKLHLPGMKDIDPWFVMC